MSKIMLVEDDNNLREIYEARLLAEGYEIVSAKDGEEALALAVKERPDLIISDVMMPKISGFDMLDILRSTPETKNTKVIMMTALSQAEDKARADKLGADRYLVKSQVTLEDVARVAREVITEDETGVPSNPEPEESDEPVGSNSTPQPQPISYQPQMPVAEPALAGPAPAAVGPSQQTEPIQAPQPSPTPGAGVPVSTPIGDPAQGQTQTIVSQPVSDDPASPSLAGVSPVPEPDDNANAVQPTEPVISMPPYEATEYPSGPVQGTDIETPPEPVNQPTPDIPLPPVQQPAPDDIPAASEPSAQEEAEVKQQIEDFVSQVSAGQPEPVAPSEPPTAATIAPTATSNGSLEQPQPSIIEPAVAPPQNNTMPQASDQEPESSPAQGPANRKVLQPTGNIDVAGPDLNALAAAEEAKEAAAQQVVASAPQQQPAPQPMPQPEQNPDDPNNIAL